MKFRGRQWIFMGAVVGLIAIAFATRGIDLFGQSSAARPQMSEQAFKNIQVLKGIPVDEFMGTMGLFSAALSVCCGDCHTGAGTSSTTISPLRTRTCFIERSLEVADNCDPGGASSIRWSRHEGLLQPSSRRNTEYEVAHEYQTGSYDLPTEEIFGLLEGVGRSGHRGWV